MKRIVWLFLILSIVFVGCTKDQLSIQEVDKEHVNDNVKEFIDHLHLTSNHGNGIYTYEDSEKRRYLYLDHHFLDNGHAFGDISLETDDDSLNIFINEDQSNSDETNAYKLYELTLDQSYEYVRVYKNDTETFFQVYGK